jgi:hypothetical protein
MPMSRSERYVWYALTVVALAVALYLGMMYPGLHDNLRWTPL